MTAEQAKRRPRRPASTEREADVRLGQAIRGLRKERSLTLVQVAAASGLSHPFLSQLERGRARPSMRSLFQIAQALGTTQQALLSAAAASSADAVVRGSDADLVDVLTGGARLLVHDRHIDVTEFVNSPTEFADFFQHDSHEFLYVVAGTIEVEIVDDAGPRLETLGPRDSVGYPGRTEHRFRQVGQTPSVVLVIHAAEPGDTSATDLPKEPTA
ncbi:helix-turn-helix domain-containing protein [Occultella gossypii]|uniref:Helix-turn-helix transcriptional regulator n=1 Tax=Occultella gossypii TaxID=2800820 RepID=A0ABS7SEI5_9MICO|nr:XRE family transcriptional regulator [Occultella gossypii]MBZ2198160.1 helix-turn-helix transcriptional regulator [Occultella gossypii]